MDTASFLKKGLRCEEDDEDPEDDDDDDDDAEMRGDEGSNSEILSAFLRSSLGFAETEECEVLWTESMAERAKSDQ